MDAHSTPPKADAGPHLKPGSRLGEYEVVALLGEGALAQVYKARCVRTGLVHALKRTRPDRRTPKERARVLRACALLRRVEHPGLVRLVGLTTVDGFPCPVTEWVDGPNLRQVVRREGCLDPRRAELIFRRLLDALEALHDQGIVHRDLKPSNVVLAAGDRPILVDFGIATGPGEDSRLTSPGHLVGTAGYLAPELATVDGKPTPASDVFSAGCVLYWMVCGRGPFDDRHTAVDKLRCAALRRYPAAHALEPDLPATIATSIDAALEPDPRRRPQDVGTLRRLLDGRSSALPRRPTGTLDLAPETLNPLVAIGASMTLITALFAWAAVMLTWLR